MITVISIIVSAEGDKSSPRTKFFVILESFHSDLKFFKDLLKLFLSKFLLNSESFH